MNKLKLAKQAQKLYEIENLNADEISEKLEISRRTVFNWMKKYNWVKKRINIEEIKNNFGRDTEELALKMMKKISSDIDAGKKLSQEELYSVMNILEYLPALKKSMKLPTLINSDKPKTLTPETIIEIENMLGLNF
ncbi:MAG: helix-turn-helix domain-containing protein [Candidatus Gastranaerophilales bacterium]|nr:helix-turn-helix domain-containing protein [Candidatus Gastranaerophilales bacterium]